MSGIPLAYLLANEQSQLQRKFRHTYQFTLGSLGNPDEGEVMKRNFIPAVGLSLGLALLVMPVFGQHVHQLYYNNIRSVDKDLTALTKSATANTNNGIAAFCTTPNLHLHVYYVDVSNHVHRLFYNNKTWNDEDLAAENGGIIATPTTQVSRFAIGNLQHTFYLGS